MRAIQKWSYISNSSRFDRDMTKNIFGRDDKFLKTRIIDLIITSNLNLIMTSGLNLIMISTRLRLAPPTAGGVTLCMAEGHAQCHPFNLSTDSD